LELFQVVDTPEAVVEAIVGRRRPSSA